MHAAKRTLVVIVAATLLLSFSASGDEWPQWRGPNRDGISKESGLLKEWPKEGPKLLWQAKGLGGGYGSPSVATGRIYVVANKGLEEESVKALDAKDGKEIWSTRIGKVGNPDQQPNYPAARSTPTVDGALIFAIGSDGDLACLDAASGKVKWQKSLRSDLGGNPGTWAYAESPLIDGNAVVCTPGGADATVAALDKNTGDVIWKSSLPGGGNAGYASLVSTETGGVKQYLAFTAGGLFGIDAKTGKSLWKYDKTKGSMGMSAMTPVARDGFVYTGAGRVGGGTVKLDAEQGGVKAEEVYFDTKLPSALGGAVLVGDNLYGSGGQALVCADFKTGQIKWSDRSVAPGALCVADGRLYLHGENGDVALIEATPDAYRELGRFSPPDQPKRANRMEKAWAYPVIADGRLYIRDTDCLWCYDIIASRQR